MNESAQGYWLGRLGTADAYNDWIFSEIADHLGDRVLEVGCGNGNFTWRLAARTRALTAVDIDVSFVEQTRQRTRGLDHVSVTCGDVTTMTWAGGGFDSVIMLDVLEHIENDAEMLRSLRRALVPDGCLILKVPAMPRIFNNLDRAVGHFRRYSRASLRHVVTEGGYVVDRIWGFNLIGALGWWVNGSLLGRSIPPSEHISGFNHLVPVLRRIESALPPPVGASLFAIARVPRNT